MTTGKNAGTGGWLATTAATALAAAATILPSIGAAAGLAAFATDAVAQSTGAPDKLILRSGRTVEGKVLEETETRVKFLVVSGGISAERWFDRTEILAVHRTATPDASASEPSKADKRPAPGVASKDPVRRAPAANASKVYVVELKGKFGVDISQTPIRDAIRDAKKYNPDYLIFVLDNDFSQEGAFEQLPDDTGASGELFRAEEMCPIFAEEIPDQWSTEGGGETPPQIVFWIKQAMGGAAILPLSCPNIYFAPDARLGGLGDLSLRLGGTGDEVVRQKLYSAYMAHVESWGIKGGYDYRLIRAICRFEYVLSYRWQGGKPEYLERMPENADEFLLTDDGDESAGRRDTIQERARGLGNDVLTLNADLARRLSFSKDTVKSLDDLLFSLGIGRTSEVIAGRSQAIMEGWSRGVTDAKRDLRRLVRDYNEVQVEPPGGYNERSRARGARINKLNEMKKIIKRFGEALTPQFYREYNVPTEQQIDQLIERIRLEQQADKR